jgi:Na+/melibiose symporter-like transporter
MYYFQGLPVFVFNALSMVSIGVLMVMSLSMLADTVEYGEWKTGKRSESIIFSIGTFSALLSGAIGGAVPGYWLSLSGYVANAVQKAPALDAMNMMLSWAAAIALLIMTIILFFYNLSEKRYAEILKELETRRLAA